jgi:hypothetical protein
MGISREDGFFPRGLSGRGVKVNTRLHVIPTLKWVELYLHCTLRLDDVDENNFTFFTFNFYFLYFEWQHKKSILHGVPLRAL